MTQQTPEPPSKSQKKREMHALQALGERLVGLPAPQLDALGLPPALHDAVAQARGIHARGGRKRQLQYIGKLMRDVDPEPIRRALASIDGDALVERARLHRCEAWRDRLLAQGDGALADLFEQHPDADRQHLRRLVREARAERDAGKAPRHQRELFRALKAMLSV